MYVVDTVHPPTSPLAIHILYVYYTYGYIVPSTIHASRYSYTEYQPHFLSSPSPIGTHVKDLEWKLHCVPGQQRASIWHMWKVIYLCIVHYLYSRHIVVILCCTQHTLHIHKHTHTHIHTHTRTHTRVCTHAHTNAHTCTHTHAHTQCRHTSTACRVLYVHMCIYSILHT